MRRRNLNIKYICYSVVLIVLLICSVQDIRCKKIHVQIPIVAGFFGGVMWLVCGEKLIADLIYDCVPGVVLILSSILSKEKIGLGDGMIVVMIGLLTEVDFTFYVVMLSFGISVCCFGLNGLMCNIRRKYEDKMKEIAFVPCIFAAYIFVSIFKIII